MSSSRRIVTYVAIATVGTVGAAVSVWLYRSVHGHGWEGTLRYIWEGDYYAEDVRSALNTLKALETQVAGHAALMELIETSLARAKLNSVDDHSSVKKEEWASAHRPRNLEKDIIKLSYDLDKLAATADAVVLQDVDMRPKKKLLSTKIVKLMEKADELLRIYQRKDPASQ